MKTQVKTNEIKVTNADRVSVMKLAWELIRKSGLSFAAAVRRAYAVIRLRAAAGSVSFAYINSEGEVRPATADNTQAPERTSSGSDRKINLLVITYYDVTAAGWRSFRADRLIIA